MKTDETKQCPVCSAPYEFGMEECEYCGHSFDIENLEEEFYVLDERHEKRLCPHCNIEMLSIKVLKNYDIIIEKCPRCSGMFFDMQEMENLLRLLVKEKDDVIERIDSSDFKPVDFNSNVRYINCPVCKQPMQRISFEQDSGVVYDFCLGHGIFLDAGELKQLTDWKRHEGQKYFKKDQEDIKKYLEKKNIEYDENFRIKPQRVNMMKDYLTRGSDFPKYAAAIYVAVTIFRLIQIATG